MSDTLAFHSPADFGIIPITTSQRNVTFAFVWDTDVIPESQVVIVHKGKVVRRDVVGAKLVISGADKVITWYIDGPDLEAYAGETVEVICSFFIEGNEEVTFQLKIEKGRL